MLTLAAALPILAILLLMLGLRWSAARAGAAALGLALAVGVFGFGLGREVYPTLGAGGAAGGALAEAGFIALTILWIVFPALCIYQLQVRTGAIEALREAMTRISPDPRVVAVVIAWFFSLFLEGAAGFGTPIALAAPFLVGMGFRPVEALTAALVGHAVGVSFGAVGTPVMAQVGATAFGGREIAAATALFHLLLGGVMLLFLLHALDRSSLAASFVGRPRPWWVLWAGVLFLVPFYLIARWIGPELPTLGGALVGGLGFVVLARLRRPATPGDGGPDRAGAAPLLRAAAPYLVLVALILATRLVDPVQTALSGWRLEWSLFGVFRGSVQPLYHPGTMLFLGFLGGAWLQRTAPRDVAAAALDASRQLALVTLALVTMLGVARVMVHAGMIETLALAAAGATGGAWPLFAPAVGVLGTFVTGSATASNILLTDFQTATAGGLGLPVLPLLAAQGFGAAVGNIVCPHNIIAGGATVGLAGREAEVLRRTALPCAVYALLGGVLALALTGLGG
jgi:lactate permease